MYSKPPLTDFALRRSQLTSVSMTSPLTDPRSRPRALTLRACTVPLTLPIDRLPSVVMPSSVTSPEIVFAASTFGVPLVTTSPLTLSARTAPRMPVAFTLPEIDFSSTAAPAGTTTV